MKSRHVTSLSNYSEISLSIPDEVIEQTCRSYHTKSISEYAHTKSRCRFKLLKMHQKRVIYSIETLKNIVSNTGIYLPRKHINDTFCGFIRGIKYKSELKPVIRISEKRNIQ